MPNYIFFKLFEEREERFRDSVHSLLPRKYSGIPVFWKDMANVLNGNNVIPENQLAYISSNPRDSLPYTFVSDLLRATSLILPNKISENVKISAIKEFNIDVLLSQKIHSLSGGEVVRLALARNYMLSHVVDKVIVSSPLTWLSINNMHLFKKMTDYYTSNAKRVDVLAMEGENEEGAPKYSFKKNLSCGVEFKDLVIKLGSDSNGAYSNGLISVQDYRDNIDSPCLIIGDNGSGKSLIAKALSSSIEYDGNAQISTNGFWGRSRMIFQDVITQAMMRPFDVLLSDVDKMDQVEIYKIFNEISRELFSVYRDMFCCDIDIGNSNKTDKSLIEYKIMLTAIRIYTHPSALILDEPDWGLSKNASIAFVISAVNAAHERGVAILLISHKDWWTKIIRSIIKVDKDVSVNDSVLFKINVGKKLIT
jgi:energy-coupling factor transporter ATP-binding protein EcfA2